MSKLPPWSIVIPTYKGRALLEKHLPDVAKVVEPGDQVVIVDDASGDDTIAWLETQVAHWKKRDVTLTIVGLTKNARFAGAVNAGVEAAQHSYVCLLNNDVSPISSEFKKTALSYFADQPQLFAVGCAEVQTTQPNAQVFGRGTGNFRRGLLVHWYDPDQTQTKTLWTSGGSMVFDTAKYRELDGMDKLFAPAYEEDRDLSYRALKHGWTILFAPELRVLHQHETTNQTAFGKRNIEIVSWKNQFLFVWKNITDANLMLQHVLWLPYHLTVSNWRSGGAAGQGFLRAVQQLGHALRQRNAAQELWEKTDEQVLNQSGS